MNCFRPICCKTFVGVLVFSFRNPSFLVSRTGTSTRLPAVALPTTAEHAGFVLRLFISFCISSMILIERFQNVLRAIGIFFVDVIEVQLHLLLLLFLQGLTSFSCACNRCRHVAGCASARSGLGCFVQGSQCIQE